MTHLFPNIMGPGVGVFPGNGSVIVRNVTASTIPAGATVVLDLSASDADVVSVIPGHANATTGAADSIFGCVILPASVAHVRTGQALVLLESIAAGATGKAAPTGIVPAMINLRIGDIAAGAPLAMQSVSGTWGLCPLSAIASNATVGEKIVGYAMTASSIASSASSSASSVLMNVWFNGFGAGFGQNAG